MTKRRYQPYAPPRAHPSDERTNAEAGPSNPVAPSIPNVASPPTDPSGGISEATADAENTDSNTEENVTPVSNFYCPHVPHVPERAFSARHGVPVVLEGRAQHGTGTGGTSKDFAHGHRGGRPLPSLQRTQRL